MQRGLILCGLLACLAGFADTAWSDFKVEPAPQRVTVPLRVGHRRGLTNHKIYIPKNLTAGLKLGQAESDSKPQLASPARIAWAGCAISMAVGGVVLLRRRKNLVAAALCAGALGMVAGSISWADVPPPRRPNPMIDMEFPSDGDAVILVIPA